MKKVMPWQHCLGTVFAFRAFSTEFGPTNYLNVLVWILFSHFTDRRIASKRICTE